MTTNYTAATVSVLIGTGTGAFAPHSDYPCGSNPLGLISGDLNGDGKLDLAVINDLSSQVSILLNAGNGVFNLPTAVTAGPAPLKIVSGDLNGDGNLDIVVSNGPGIGTVSVLLGQGDGTFPVRRDFGAGPNPWGIAVGNVDSRTLPEVIVGNSMPGPSPLATLYNRAIVTSVITPDASRGMTSLAQNFPNPFNPTTTIRFDLARPGHAAIHVFDVRGRLVAKILDEYLQSGPHEVRWGGVTTSGQDAASGVYFYRLSTNAKDVTRRMVLSR